MVLAGGGRGHGSRPFRAVVDDVVDLSRGPEWATWFLGAKLNIAWNCVHRWRSDRVATVFRGEDGTRRELTFAELSDAVTRLAERLVELGVEPGDRVVIYLPMSPEVAIASHACAHVGAVQVPVFSGFAAPAVAQRLVDSGAKVAITARRRCAAGRPCRCSRSSRRHAARRPRSSTWSSRRGTMRSPAAPARSSRSRSTPSTRTCSRTRPARPAGPRASSTSRAASSCSIAREACYQADADAGRRRALLHGHGLDHGAVDRGRLRGHGLDARLRRGRARLARRPALAAVRGGARHDSRLLADAGPGADPARRPGRRSLVAARVRDDGRAVEPRARTAGCSSVSAAGACRSSTSPAARRSGRASSRCSIAEPIKECSLGGPSLGMAMDVLDPEGRSLVGTGEVGELVCRAPFPGMTRGFWHDPERYLDDVLAPLPRDLDPRRLGLGRRRRLLVPPRPLRRHAEHRGQADRAGRDRVGGGRAPGRDRGGGGRRPARGQGRGRLGVLRARPRGSADRRTR